MYLKKNQNGGRSYKHNQDGGLKTAILFDSLKNHVKWCAASDNLMQLKK